MPGLVVWFTGPPATGKSTQATLLAGALRATGSAVEILDGDEVRRHLSTGLGFSREDRDTNIRRIGYVARLLARNGVVAIVAAVSPYRAAREEVRAAVVAERCRFVEVAMRCPLEVLVERDPKGLYRRALRGELKQFTGVDDPYVEPLAPEVVIDSSARTIEDAHATILGVIR
jgi:adenylyl-sulfate kinase